MRSYCLTSNLPSGINLDGVLKVWTVFFIKKLNQKINESSRVQAGEPRFDCNGVKYSDARVPLVKNRL